MVRVTLSKVMYDLLMTILNQNIRQANADFSAAPLNSEEESHASIRMSVLMDVMAELVTTAETVHQKPDNTLVSRN